MNNRWLSLALMCCVCKNIIQPLSAPLDDSPNVFFQRQEPQYYLQEISFPADLKTAQRQYLTKIRESNPSSAVHLWMRSEKAIEKFETALEKSGFTANQQSYLRQLTDLSRAPETQQKYLRQIAKSYLPNEAQRPLGPIQNYCRKERAMKSMQEELIQKGFSAAHTIAKKTRNLFEQLMRSVAADYMYALCFRASILDLLTFFIEQQKVCFTQSAKCQLNFQKCPWEKALPKDGGFGVVLPPEDEMNKKPSPDTNMLLQEAFKLCDPCIIFTESLPVEASTTDAPLLDTTAHETQGHLSSSNIVPFDYLDQEYALNRTVEGEDLDTTIWQRFTAEIKENFSSRDALDKLDACLHQMNDRHKALVTDSLLKIQDFNENDAFCPDINKDIMHKILKDAVLCKILFDRYKANDKEKDTTLDKLLLEVAPYQTFVNLKRYISHVHPDKAPISAYCTVFDHSPKHVVNGASQTPLEKPLSLMRKAHYQMSTQPAALLQLYGEFLDKEYKTSHSVIAGLTSTQEIQQIILVPLTPQEEILAYLYQNILELIFAESTKEPLFTKGHPKQNIDYAKNPKTQAHIMDIADEMLIAFYDRKEQLSLHTNKLPEQHAACVTRSEKHPCVHDSIFSHPKSGPKSI